MKKFYLGLASLMSVAALSAAVPTTTISGMDRPFELKTITVSELQSSVESLAQPRKSAIKRIPASESLIDLEMYDYYPFGNNSYIYMGKEWNEVCCYGWVDPVEGKENTYLLDCFNPFSDIDDIKAEATLDPATGVLRINTDKPLGKAELNLGSQQAPNKKEVELYLKGAQVSSTGDITLDPDASIEFEFEEMSLRLSDNTRAYFLAFPSPFEGESGKWYFLACYQQSLISYCTAIGYDSYYNGQASRQRSYGMFVMPASATQIAIYNAFGIGEFNYEVMADYDGKNGLITFDNQVIGKLTDPDTNEEFPLYIGNENDNVLDATYDADATQGDAILFDIDVPTGWCDNVLQFYLYSFNTAVVDCPIWYPLFNLSGMMNSSAPQIATDDENAPVEYFNLQGIKISNPENGIFVRRQGSKVSKVIL